MLKHKNSGFGIGDVDKRKSVVVGYASRFGNIDSHGDIIQKGAFSRTLNHGSERIKSLMHHDPVMIVGKPMVMREDENGLYTETKISDTSLGRDLLTLVADGVIDEMSIGFIPVKEEYDKEAKANILKEVRLLEYSFVSLASNDQARVQGLKGSAAVTGIAASMKRFEKALRDGHFESDEVPEAMDFIVKYWRSVLEASKSEDIVEFETQEGDSPEGTHSVVSDSVDSTRDDVLSVLKNWQVEYEILSAIKALGGNLKG